MKNESQTFSLKDRAMSFAHAGRGISLFLKTTHNAWIEIIILLVVIVLGFYFGITRMEWLAIVLASGLVLSAEALNTAIEIDMNLTSPEYHPAAKATKDVAAGAVLISAIAAVAVGIIVFWPYLFK